MVAVRSLEALGLGIRGWELAIVTGSSKNKAESSTLFLFVFLMNYLRRD